MTAYDFTFARLVDEIADLVLVGDSLGMVIKGESDTLSVTMDEMIYHTRAVSRGLRTSHLVADMPFMSYQPSEEVAIKNAGRLLSEGKAEAVKLEGGVAVAGIVEKMVQFGIPVLGHIGLTPQSYHHFGGYKVQGKTVSSKEAILQDALALEDAGVYAMVLEGIPEDLAKTITERVRVPTIGIGAGVHCDGQVLVLQDLLGLNPDFKPKFVKRFGNFDSSVKQSVLTYAEEVRKGIFPDATHTFHADT